MNGRIRPAGGTVEITKDGQGMGEKDVVLNTGFYAAGRIMCIEFVDHINLGAE